MGKAPHAEEILAFYVGLIEIQERVADRVPAERWLALVRSSDGEFPQLRLERLPVDDLVPRFDAFLGGVADAGTSVMTARAEALLAAAVTDRRTLLGNALASNEPPDDETGFCARAFLEPLVTSLAAADSRTPQSWTHAHCFECGASAGVAVLRDLPEALGRRSLVCSLCATEWRFKRLTCAHCGETEANQLLTHTADSVAHVRIDECKSCGRYLKTVDLRIRGDAVPVVDELATVELDLWARDRGLEKLQPNVLGL